MVRHHAPSLGVLKGDGVRVLPTDRWGKLPQRASDLRVEPLGGSVGSPFLGQDRDMVPFVQKSPGCDQASDASPDDQDSRRQVGWCTQGSRKGSQISPEDEALLLRHFDNEGANTRTEPGL